MITHPPASDVRQLQHRYGVVHFGRRDQYQVAVSLAEIGALERLFTDFYTPDWLLAGLQRTAPALAQRFQARHDPGLSARLTTSLLPEFLWITRWRARKLAQEQIQEALGNLGAEHAAGYVARHPQVGVVSYSYHWPALSAARAAGGWAGPAIVFQVHPIAQQISRILHDDRARTGLSYSLEVEELQTSEAAIAYAASLQHTDGIIVASEFTARGLLEVGVPADKIALVPYGATMTESAAPSAAANTIEDTATPSRWRTGYTPLRLLWVGQLAYRKGAHHLFAALRHFSPQQVQLSLVTRGTMPAELEALMPPNVTVCHASDQQREQMYRTHHLFVLPSMIEGFGQVYLEAMAGGLPILCTPNTGGADLIHDGVEGFIVAAGQSDAIAECIESCLRDPGLLAKMSAAAQQTAATWTWPRFRRGIRWCLAEFERSMSAQASSRKKKV